MTDYPLYKPQKSAFCVSDRIHFQETAINAVLLKNTPVMLRSGLNLFLIGMAFSMFTSTTVAHNTNKQETIMRKQVVVTGTRTPDRSVIDSPVPIDVLTPDELRQSGTLQGEVGELIGTILPSAFMQRNSNDDFGDVVRTVRLRGLDPAQTLVLINGKRRHKISTTAGAAVDLNNIPVSSIKRIEVLRDGAAAQYGSDAIAGVINIILKDADEGGALSSTYGGHITSFKPTDDLITDGQTVFVAGNKGFKLGQNGYMNLTAEFRDRNATNRAGAPDSIPFFENQTPPNLALRGQRNFRAGDSSFTDVNTMLNSGVNLSNNIELYLFGSFSYRHGKGINFFRYPDSSSNVPEIYPNGFLPITNTKQRDYSVVGGAKGETGSNWKWDASVGYGANNFDFDMSNSVNASLGTASPTRFDVANYTYQHVIVNLDMSKPFHLDLLKNPLQVGYGFEYRHENYITKSGDQASYIAGPLAASGAAIGVQGNGGLRPEDTVNASRDSGAFYIDLKSDITDRLLLGTAGRFEYYSDFGETLNGKFTARYEIVPQFALRGSVGSGFRAPSLTQSFFKGGTTDFGATTNRLVLNKFLPTNDPVARLLGARDLQPEKSRNFSIGFTFKTDRGLNLTVDAYQIDIDDRIVESQRIGGEAVTNFLNANLGISDISSLTYFTNAVDTQTRGIDAVLDYSFAVTPSDLLNLRAAGIYTATHVKKVKDNPTVLDNLGVGAGTTVIGENEIIKIERSLPRAKMVLSGNWIRDNLSALTRLTYLGSTRHKTPFGDQKFGSEWLLDMDIEYNFTKKLSLAIGGRNVLDNYPDLTVTGNSYFNNLPYDVVAPIGMNGAYYYTRLTYILD